MLVYFWSIIMNKITDERTHNFFIGYNEIFDFWGEKIKIQGIGIYLCLVRHASNNSCFPSHNRIAKQCGLSESSVKRTLKMLESFGLIKIVKRHNPKNNGQTSNEYIIKDLPPVQCEPHPSSEGTAPKFSVTDEEDIIKKTNIKKTTDDIDNSYIPHARSNPKTNSVKSSSIDVKKDKILSNVVYPKGFRKSQPVLKELQKLPNTEAVQQVLDVYAEKDNVRSPVAYIRQLVKNYLADDFTPINKPVGNTKLNTPETKEKSTCEFCENNDGMIFFKKDEGTSPIRCDHNHEKIIAHAQRTHTLVEGTKHDFRENKPPKPKNNHILSIKKQNATKRKLEAMIGGFNNPANLPKE